MAQAARIPNLPTPEEFLAAEQVAPERHEYVGGAVFAMAGGTPPHSRIKVNVIASLANRLRGRRCEVFDSDMMLRIQLPTHITFYYPDAHVICAPEPEDQLFHDHPVVVIEVISESTRRTDGWEKKNAYLSVDSLGAYLLIEQSEARAEVWRRSGQAFVHELWTGLDSVIPLPEIESSLPLAEVYENVKFPSKTAALGASPPSGY